MTRRSRPAHEAEMAAGDEDMDAMGDKPYAVDIPAGETVTLVYTFDEAGHTDRRVPRTGTLRSRHEGDDQ